MTKKAKAKRVKKANVKAHRAAKRVKHRVERPGLRPQDAGPAAGQSAPPIEPPPQVTPPPVTAPVATVPEAPKRRGRPAASLELTDVDRRILETLDGGGSIDVPLSGKKPETVVNGIRVRLAHAGHDLEIWREYAPEHVKVWVKRRRPKAAASDGI